MNCKFCNQSLTPTPGHSKCNLWCGNHNMFVYYYLKNLVDIDFLALYENSPKLKCIQLNYATNKTHVFIDNTYNTPILTLNRILTNLTPDNFHNKFKTIITFS